MALNGDDLFDREQLEKKLFEKFEAENKESDAEILRKMYKAKLIPENEIKSSGLHLPDFSKKLIDLFPNGSSIIEKLTEDMKKGIIPGFHSNPRPNPKKWTAMPDASEEDEPSVSSGGTFTSTGGSSAGSGSGIFIGGPSGPAFPAGPMFPGLSIVTPEVAELQMQAAKLESELNYLKSAVEGLITMNQELKQEITDLRDEIEIAERERALNDKYEEEQKKATGAIVQSTEKGFIHRSDPLSGLRPSPMEGHIPDAARRYLQQVEKRRTSMEEKIRLQQAIFKRTNENPF